MPELPEVETITSQLKSKVVGLKIKDIWTDFSKVLVIKTKTPKRDALFEFKNRLKNKEIRKVRRIGKNIIFEISGDLILLIHQKMTGHLLFGKWEFKNNKWEPKIKGPIKDDPMNRFLHLVFSLNNGFQLALSDLRKFAKAELWQKKEFENSKVLKSLGPDALEISLEDLKQKLRKKKGKIKQVLMNQEVVAGIGNIYSDEILFGAKIHPLKATQKLSDREIEKLFEETGNILKKAIRLKGTSISDFRTLSGEKGDFQKIRKVYQREGEKCSRCGSIITRIKIGGRSAHFCPKCQTL